MSPELSLISTTDMARATSSLPPSDTNTSSSSSYSSAPSLPLARLPANGSDSGQQPKASPIAFIAVHAGAGYLHPSKHSAICALLQAACNAALKQAGSVEEAAAVALSVLESSPLTNAGVGSCLTEDGRVECEASIVFGNGTFGSVGAVSGVDHPIQVAYQLAIERDQHGLIKELSRVRPISLVGDGAYQFAVSRGLGVVGREHFGEHHVTDTTRATWKKYKTLIDKNKHGSGSSSGSSSSSNKRAREGEEGGKGRNGGDEGEGEGVECVDGQAAAKRTRSSQQQSGFPPSAAPGEVPESQGDSPSSTPDTVGVVVCDYQGRVCAASSSGGIWMKHRGRLGSSSMAGSGCYAENFDEDEVDDDDHAGLARASVATSVSGCGESVMEQFIAMRCCAMMKEMKEDTEQQQQQQRSESMDAPASFPSGREPIQAIMRALLVRRQVPQSKEKTRRKRRRRNSHGGQDTLEEDDGLATGVITLKAVPLGSKPAQRSPDEEQRQQQAETRMAIRFCWAHTARHFAVGFAGRSVDSSETVYDGEAWVSILSEHTKGESAQEGHKEAGLKMGEVVREIVLAQPTDTDKHGTADNGQS